MERVERHRDLLRWVMRQRYVRFTIRRLMAVVAFAAVILWLLQHPGGVFLALGLGGLVLAFSTCAGKSRVAPSTAFLCALIGAIIGFLLLPAKNTYRPTNDFRDFMDLLWVIGGAATGALVGSIIGWLDRRIVSDR